MYEESKQDVVHFKLMILAVHPNQKRIVNQVDVLVGAFIKDPHVQGTYYATLVAIVSYTPYSINIFHHDIHLHKLTIFKWSQKSKQSADSTGQGSFMSLLMLTIDTPA